MYKHSNGRIAQSVQVQSVCFLSSFQGQGGLLRLSEYGTIKNAVLMKTTHARARSQTNATLPEPHWLKSPHTGLHPRG